jgi:hypothetical protein
MIYAGRSEQMTGLADLEGETTCRSRQLLHSVCLACFSRVFFAPCGRLSAALVRLGALAGALAGAFLAA